MAIRLCEVEISAEGVSSSTEIRLSIKYLPATVTAGSGGSSVTPRPINDTDAAATFTARANDTTRATTNGTSYTQWSSSIQLTNGWVRLPMPEGIWSYKPSTACVIGLEVAPGSATTMNGSCMVEEAF
jgi:hypothetical protein